MVREGYSAIMKDDVLIRGSAKQGVSIIINDETEYAQVKYRLRERLAAANGFFKGAEVTLDVGNRKATPDQVQELEAIVREHCGAAIIKVIKGPSAKQGADKPEGPAWSEEHHSPRVEKSHYQQAMDDSPSSRTLLVKRTIRSGQKINFEGNVVIVGDVNPGAEVIAGGDIVVMGIFRGLAHAGASGDESAIITAFRLLPTQLRIASMISRAPDDDGARTESPEIARIRNGSIVVETACSYT